MTLTDSDVSTLNTLLEQERELLLEGDLGGLAALLPLKEQLVDKLLDGDGVARDKVRPFENKLKRNQLLLDGALDGLRTVASRLAALRQVRLALDTYDSQGRRQHVVTATRSKIEKRA